MRYILTALLLVLATNQVGADEFTYVDQSGKSVTTSARIIGEGQGFVALERWDGQIQPVPAGAITERKVTGDPDPAGVTGMQEILTELFGEDKVRFETGSESLVALILQGPLDKQGETRGKAFLKKAGAFTKNVDEVFLRFAKQMKFPLRELRYPLVLLIFESDEDFETYTNSVTGGRGLSATNILGFYSGLTNWLAVRMSSCDSFEVPLHEAIHQQMYNRVAQRLAPIPKWFDEGIATGFEASGQNINVHPLQINSRYARQTQRLTGNVDWRNIVRDDTAFTTDILAGDAYTLAWCLHWMLVTEQKEGYQEYVQKLAALPPLGEQQERERVEHFETAFGKSIPELQARFQDALQVGIKRQKVDLRDPKQPGFAEAQQQLGAIQLRAIGTGGLTKADGRLKNISPLRNMSFYVTFESESGLYTDWILADVRPGQTVPLKEQLANKRIGGVGLGSGDRFRIFIRSVAADSPTATDWKSGMVPGPVGQ